MVSITTTAVKRYATVITITLLLLASFVPLLEGSRLKYSGDDAYITLSYVKSIREGNGFRTHPDAEPTLGTTTPVFTLTIALISLILPMFTIPQIAIYFSIMMWIATGWLWAWKGHVFGLSKLSSVVIALLILSETLYRIEHLGMEWSLFNLLLTTSIITYLEKRYRSTGILMGLLILTRPEGVLLLVAFAGYEAITYQPNDSIRELIHRGKNLLLTTITSLIVLVPWGLYAFMTFGSFMPPTVASKAAQVDAGLLTFSEGTILLFTHSDYASIGIIHTTIGDFNLWLIFCLLGVFYAMMFYRKTLIFVFWMFAQFSFFILFAPAFGWYFLTGLYILTIFTGVLIGAIYDFTQRLSDTYNWKGIPRIAYCMSVGATGLILLTLIPASLSRDYTVSSSFQDYYELSIWINEHVPEHQTVAYYEVGYLSYFSERQIIDLLGLTSPELIPFMQQNRYDLVFETASPDYFVLEKPTQSILLQVLKTSFFNQNYELIAQIDSVRPNSRGFDIYRRISVQSITPTENDFVFDLTAPNLRVSTGVKSHRFDEEGNLFMEVDNDPYIILQNLELCASDYEYALLTLLVSDDLRDQQFQIFFAHPESRFTESQSVSGVLDPTQETQVIHLHKADSWAGIITALRLDPVKIAGAEDSWVRVKELRLIRSDNTPHCIVP